jgi:hypothetical protein
VASESRHDQASGTLITRPSIKWAVIVSSVTSTWSMRDSTLTAELMPGLGDSLFVDPNETPDLVQFPCAETGIPCHRDGRQPELCLLSIVTNMHMHLNRSCRRRTSTVQECLERVAPQARSTLHDVKLWRAGQARLRAGSSRPDLFRPSRSCPETRGAEAPSMPEGRAQRGRSGIRHAERIDGVEHRVTLSNVMAADHR